MAETWMEVEKIEEYIRLFRKTLQYFHIECLSFAFIDLMKYSQRRAFGLFKRRPLDLYTANKIVTLLHENGVSRPPWCTGMWPNDMEAHTFGLMPEWEIEALEELCSVSVNGRIKMTGDEMGRLIAYRSLPIYSQEKLQEFLDSDIEEFFRRAYEEMASIEQKRQTEEEAEKGSLEALCRVTYSIDFVGTAVISLILFSTAVVLATGGAPVSIALVCGALGTLGIIRSIVVWTRICRSKDD